MDGFTGRGIWVRVSHIVPGGSYGLPANLAVMSVVVVHHSRQLTATPLAEHLFDHVLKADSRPFSAVWDGEKHCEVRETTDREFHVGHVLLLRELAP